MNWIEVGKVTKAHGLKGEVFIFIFSGEVSWLKKINKVKIGNSEFEIETSRKHESGFFLKLKSINDRNQSESIIGSPFLINEEYLVSAQNETIYLREILNFKVFNFIDEDKKEAGFIARFSSNGVQDLLVIKKKSGFEFEVPFVEDFIIDINFEDRIIEMCYPEGLDFEDEN